VIEDVKRYSCKRLELALFIAVREHLRMNMGFHTQHANQFLVLIVPKFYGVHWQYFVVVVLSIL